jgi:hypothetical protein
MKQTVWTCDRCLVETKQPKFPDGWMTALVSLREFTGEPLETVWSKIWCASCWRFINATVPHVDPEPR